MAPFLFLFALEVKIEIKQVTLNNRIIGLHFYCHSSIRDAGSQPSPLNKIGLILGAYVALGRA